MDDGSRLDTAMDLYLDGRLNSIVGLFLGRESTVSRNAKFIQRKDILVFGKVAILINSEKTVFNSNSSKEFPMWIRRDQLQGRPIETPEGTRIAKVGDVTFDETGKLEGFVLIDLQTASPITDKRFLGRDVLLDIGGDSTPLKLDLTYAEKQDSNWKNTAQ